MKFTRFSLLTLAAAMTAGPSFAQSPESDSVYRALVEKRAASTPPAPEAEALVEPVVPATGAGKKNTPPVAQTAPAETVQGDVVTGDK
ncbi:MAG TPA: hypothetical protein VIM57_06850, partial [Luteolibacter sp.]